MNLIILAAGKGTRLYPLTKNTPKSLLDLGDNTTLLDRQVSSAIESSVVNKIYVITGYRTKQIERTLEKYAEKIDIETIYNPFFAQSNNLMSLWCANYIFEDDDFMITNGDNIYKSGLFDKVSSAKDDCIQITIDYKEHYDDDDMKVVIANEKLAAVSKKIDPELTNAESVGLAIVKGETKRKLFRDKIIEMSKDEDNINKFWLEIFNSFVSDGESIDLFEISQHDWGEVDFHPDIESIKKAVFSNLF